MRIDPRERMQQQRDGMLSREPLYCEECGGLLRAGTLVLCADGYARIYGEFVLSGDDPLHEENWPTAHARCVDGVPGATGEPTAT
jgi:hypothetical protein